ncbi:MAG: hypothetical protein IKR13_04560 [Victivallales bacterium]|nr:hypothetical protein [Victivallales bacterium]
MPVASAYGSGVLVLLVCAAIPRGAEAPRTEQVKSAALLSCAPHFSAAVQVHRHLPQNTP